MIRDSKSQHVHSHIHSIKSTVLYQPSLGISIWSQQLERGVKNTMTLDENLTSVDVLLNQHIPYTATSWDLNLARDLVCTCMSCSSLPPHISCPGQNAMRKKRRWNSTCRLRCSQIRLDQGLQTAITLSYIIVDIISFGFMNTGIIFLLLIHSQRL